MLSQVFGMLSQVFGVLSQVFGVLSLVSGRPPPTPGIGSWGRRGMWRGRDTLGSWGADLNLGRAGRGRAVPVAGEAPTVIPVKHCRRLLEGELLATSSRIEGAILLKRTYGVDALRCPSCEAKLRGLATSPSKDAIGAILTHVGVRTEPVPRERARDPTGPTSFAFDAA
jgi:hypothetical protein